MNELDDLVKTRFLSDVGSGTLRVPVPFAYGVQEIPGTGLRCVVVSRSNSTLLGMVLVMLLFVGAGAGLVALSAQGSTGLSVGQAIGIAVLMVVFGFAAVGVSTFRVGRRRQVTIDPARELVSREDGMTVHDRASPGWIEIQQCELRSPKPSSYHASAWLVIFGGAWLLRGGKYPTVWIVSICTEGFRERVGGFKCSEIAEHFADELARGSGLSILDNETRGVVVGQRMFGFGVSDRRVASKPRRAKPIVFALSE